MKLTTTMVLAALTLSFGANAFAQSTAPQLTRAEVIAQLAEAQRDGLVPTSKSDYPPSEREIARNREIYAIQHGQDGATATASQTSPAASGASSSN
jgi:hypothetical protein